MSEIPKIWDYFERSTDKNKKRALCKICGNYYSYSSTTGNLRVHLASKHSTDIKVPPKKERPAHYAPYGKYSKIIWGYFSQVEEEDKEAACNFCDKHVSYRTTTANLKTHLQKKHPDEYTRFLELQPPDLDAVSKEVYLTLSDEDEDTDTSTKQSDLNSYFERETGGRVRCIVCRTSVPHRDDAQRTHMHEKHPKLVGEQDQDNEQDQDQDERMPFHSDDEPEQDVFTDVVYVEDARNIEKSPPKVRPSKPSKLTKTRPQKRRASTSSDEYLIKKPKSDENDELEGFIRYIRCLLKKLPTDTCMKLQLEIVNLIMKASINNQSDSTVTIATPGTSYYVTMPDKVIQTSSQMTDVSNSADINTSTPTIIINSVNSMKETDST